MSIFTDKHGWSIVRITNRPWWHYWLAVMFANIRKLERRNP